MHLHVDNKAIPTVFEVSYTTGPVILGRAQAKTMEYVEFPKIKCPHTFTMYPATSKKICTIKTLSPETATGFPPRDSIGATPRVHVHESESTKATQAKQSRQTTEPVVPQIKWNTDSIELNGKIHKLLITKDYMLMEYSDVFKSVGTITHQTERRVQTGTTPTKVSPSSHAIYIQSRVKKTSKRRHNY